VRVKATRRCVICSAEFCAPPSAKVRACEKQSCREECDKRRGRRHGGSSTRLYCIWAGMRARTRAETGYLAKYYSHVSLCEEWSRFEVFREWAYANGYAENLQIDRIDVMGNYCPENCRWATRHQQMQNTRIRSSKNKTSKYKGVRFISQCSKKWTAQAGVNGKPFTIGRFDTEEEAAKAYDKWARQTYGEFCNPNFKEE